MPVSILPPALLERRDDERRVFALVNALRQAVINLQSVGGSAIFSSRWNASSVQDANGVETVHDQIELPVVLPSFGFIFAGQGKTASGTSHFCLRAGGGDRTVDGTVFAILPVTSIGFERYSVSGTFTNISLATRIKLTAITPAAGVQAFLKDHVLVIN